MSKLNYQSEKKKNKERLGRKPATAEQIHQRMLKFEARATKLHHGKYTYHQDYVNSKTKIRITCPIHGNFYQIPYTHSHGTECSACGKLKASKKQTSNWKDFEAKVNKVHGGKYKYYHDYINCCTKVRIWCPEHGDFEQLPSNHLMGQGCSECKKITLRNLYISNQQKFETQANIVHKGFYTYHQDYVNSKTKVYITCPIHGIFKQIPANHLRGSGCPRCRSSKGEKAIYHWLADHGFIFETEWTFLDCRNINPLPFDFWIPSLNLLIEFDGEQHFTPRRDGAWGGKGGKKTFKETQKHDQIKNEYCKTKGYRLLRIPYNDIKKIPEILERESNFSPNITV